MTSDLHTHIKHILITIALIAGALIGLKMYASYQSHIAEVMAQRDEQIAANKTTVVASEKVVTSADLELAKQLAVIKTQLSQKIDSNQAKTLVGNMLPGVQVTSTKDTQGNPLLSIADTQENRDKLNKADSDFKSCKFSLDDCLIARQEKDKQLAAKDSTIKLQADQIVDLKKYQVPKNMLFFGVGKTQGTNFQDINSYQPVIGYGRRITNRFGFMGFAQNKSVSVGATWNFGAVKQ